jgi:hypothetical protein
MNGIGTRCSGVKSNEEFNSFGGFASFLSTMTEHAAIDHELLERIAVAVEKKAKDKIGEYQAEVGPFVAWAELAESTKQDRERQGYTENDPGLRSGEMRDSIEHHATFTEAHIGSNDDKLVYFELGTDKQPPRSVLGGALFELAPKIVEEVGQTVVMTLEGEKVFRGAMKI